MITMRIHGYIDYLYSTVLIMMPWVLDLEAGIMSIFPIGLGIILLIQNIITNYELGLINIISFRIHRGLDVIIGLMLIISPWLLNFAVFSFMPFVLVGFFLVIVTYFTTMKKQKKGIKNFTILHQNEFNNSKDKSLSA